MYDMFRLEFGLTVNKVGEAAKGHMPQGAGHNWPSAAHGRLLLPLNRLIKHSSLHLELLGRYVATAVHVILPPDLQ